MFELPEYEAFLKALRQELETNWKGKIKVLADMAGISTPYISELKHKKKVASLDTQVAVANACGFSYIAFLERGFNLMKAASLNTISESQTYPFQIATNGCRDKERLECNKASYRRIPLYASGRLAAGSNGVYFDHREIPEREMIIYRPELGHRFHHRLAAVRVSGNSMAPLIPQDAIVVVDLEDRKFVNRKVFCVNIPEGDQWMAAVKRVQKWQHGFLLNSDSSDGNPPIPAELDWSNLCVGRVIWIWRNAEGI